MHNWLSRHAWMGALSVGVLIGVLLALPIFETTLPDGVATLLGSAIGAGLAVAGAAWVATAKERAEASALRESASAALEPCISAWSALLAQLEGAAEVQPRYVEEIRSIRRIGHAFEQCQEALDKLAPSYSGSPIYTWQFHELGQELLRARKANGRCERELVTVNSAMVNEQRSLAWLRFGEARSAATLMLASLNESKRHIGSHRVSLR